MCKAGNGKLAPLKFNGILQWITYDIIKLLNQEKKVSMTYSLHDGMYLGNGNYLFFEIHITLWNCTVIGWKMNLKICFMTWKMKLFGNV